MSGWRDRLRGKQQPSGGRIHVTMTDAATHRVIGETDLEPSQLPELFDLSEHSTTMHIFADDWHVEKADPWDRPGYVASGQLHLVLRKVETMDPKDILFSLPTLVDALPPIVPGSAADAYALHEDDWRQREFVATSFQPEITSEFDMIRAARAGRIGVGFERLHVREQIPEPLAGVALPLAAVRRALGDPARRDVAVGGGLVAGGYAFAVAGGVVYGREVEGQVVALGLAENADFQTLAGLAADHDLVLVDWVRAETS